MRRNLGLYIAGSAAGGSLLTLGAVALSQAWGRRASIGDDYRRKMMGLENGGITITPMDDGAQTGRANGYTAEDRKSVV